MHYVDKSIGKPEHYSNRDYKFVPTDFFLHEIVIFLL